MLIPPSPVRGLACALAFLSALTPIPAAQAQSKTAGGYTVTKIVDQNTPVPDRPGTTFSPFSGNSAQVFVTDGTNAAFTFDVGAGTPTEISVWSVPVSGGTPVRLVDTTKVAPDGAGQLFNNVAVAGIGGGVVVFVGNFPIAGSYSGGSGLYAVPAGGGTITTLVDSNTAVPGSTASSFGFNVASGHVAVHGSQVFFVSAGGIYSVPVTGGAVTRFGDASTPLVDSAGVETLPDGFQDSLQQVDFGGGIVAFNTTGANEKNSGDLYTAPSTGLTVDASGFVNNAEYIAGQTTPVPGAPAGSFFNPYETATFVDDSGTPVFAGAPSISAPAGLYSSINGAVMVLANNNTTAGNGDTFSSIFNFTIAVGGGKAYFEADGLTAAGDSNAGIYSVPVLGGAVTPVVTYYDPTPANDGTTFTSFTFTYGGVGGGKIVFVGGNYTYGAKNAVAGLYLATPGSTVTIPPSNQLILSNHTGGNTGPVSLTATIIPGAPALVSGATVKLSASGLSDIGAKSVTVDAAGTSLTTIIDLKGQAVGTYDFVITNPDGTTITQAAAFTVEAATGPNVFGDLIGRYLLRAGKPQAYTIVVGNSGDVDAAGVPVFVSFPNYLTCQVVSPLTTPPQPVGLPQPFDFSQIPLTYPNGPDQTVLPLLVGRVPAHGVATVQVLFTLPDVPQYAHIGFDFNVSVGEPFIDAETGMVPNRESAESHDPDGKHEDKVGIDVTCAASFFNVAVDCLSTFVPELQAVKCAPGLILAAENGYLGINSDSENQTNNNASIAQAGVGGTLAIANCVAQALGTSIIPGVGVFVNGIQCGIDTYLLVENCIKPAAAVPGQGIVSGDPNDLDGSIGDGSAAHYLTGAEPLRYLVSFENEDTATAPAQTVTITNPLDANLDLSTFSLGPISFGSTLLNPPAGSQNYSTVVDLRPANNLLVRVTAALNTSSRALTYSFVSLDPATNQPTTDPAAGFLPPDVKAPAGDGFVVYYAKPKTGLATGTIVNDQASIVFDVNAPIATPTWTNTLDNDAPTSHVSALRNRAKSAQIPLQLVSSDIGSGVKYFNVYVAEDGGKFQPLVKNAAGPTVTYTGVTGHNYAFFSQAVDGAGNVEPLKTAAEAKTKIRGADLVGDWQGSIVEKTTASGRIKLKKGSFQVTNQSAMSATTGSSVVRFYLSADGTFDASDPVIGSDVAFGTLAPGASVTLRLPTVKLPAGTVASGMYVIAVIDPDHTIKETDYTNNSVAYGPLP